ncbi:glycosyltransferase [Cellulomonas marina]|uniref:glycosyltransferase n=2 Tax=Cellulomonas marina TaxID=988821 RepID=UPI001C31AA8A|nr:glycosyltransferase [Cellulomonas marina]
MSVVVPTYQRRDLLPRVLRPLLADPALHELVVVVDGSTDGTAELLARARAADPRVRPVLQPNRGLAAARQRGAEEATGDLLLLLDDDVLPGPGLPGAHAAAHARADDPCLVLVGHMPNDPRRVPRERRAVAEMYARAYAAASAGWEAGDDVLLHFWAGHFSLRRDAALRIGLATPGDEVYRRQEDRDFGMRALAAGYRGVFDRGLHAEHLFERGMAAWRRECFETGAHRSHLERVHHEVLGVSGGAVPRGVTHRRRPLALALGVVAQAVATTPVAGTVVDAAVGAHALVTRVPGTGAPARFLALRTSGGVQALRPPAARSMRSR